MKKIFPWQQSALEQMKSAQQQQRLSHALLFSGEQGIGKRNFAEYLAQSLLCLNPQEFQACGNCKSCDLYQSSNHPDIMLLEPEDAAKQIKIDDVRAANEFLQKTSQQGGVKVLVITPAEAMNINASNAILKTLEEPADDSYLILITHSISRLLPTLRSRCRRYDFALPSIEQSENWLAAQDVDSIKAQQALLLAGQRPLLAKRLIEQDQLGMQQKVTKDIEQIVSGKSNFLDVANSWKDYDFILLLQYLCLCLNALVRSAIIDDETQIKDHALSSLYLIINKNSSLETLFKLYEFTLDVREQGLSKANINRQLLIENLLLQWQSRCSQAA